MKIEKIHLNKIKVTFTPEDLVEHNITVDAVKNNAPWIQKVLMNVVKRAEEETGFSAADCRLMVEAMPADGDCLVMYITRLEAGDDLKDLMHNVKRRIKLKARTIADTQRCTCVKFAEFEDAVRMAHFFTKENGGALYFFDNSYYMIFDNTNPLFAEFGEVFEKDSCATKVTEHGKLISDNALENLRLHF